MTSEVLVDFAEGIALICINRPKSRNAINLNVARAIAAAIDELDSRSDLRAGTITGAGGTFCSGMDLKAYIQGEIPIIKGSICFPCRKSRFGLQHWRGVAIHGEFVLA